MLLLYNLILILFYLFFIFFYSLHCPLSGPDLTYISLLIIPCIIYHVTNKETLNLEPTAEAPITPRLSLTDRLTYDPAPPHLYQSGQATKSL